MIWRPSDRNFETPPPIKWDSGADNVVKSESRRSKLRRFFRTILSCPDFDRATFERFETKRSPQEMRKNGLY